MKTLKKFYNKRDHWVSITLAFICFALTVFSFIFGIIPYWDKIMQSPAPLNLNNPWISYFLFQIFFGIFALGFLLDHWFYKTNRTKRPLIILNYIAVGIIFGLFPMTLIWTILSTTQGSVTNVWIFEPILGAFCGIFFSLIVNFKKQ